MVHYLMAGAVESRRQVGLGHGHADGVGQALSQRTGCGLHARRAVRLRVARRPAAPLAKLLDIFQGEIVAAEVQQAIEEHGTVAGGKNEAVAIGPGRVRRIVPEEPCPQTIGHGCGTHGQARMSRVGLLDRVHGQKAQGVSAEQVKSVRFHASSSFRFGVMAGAGNGS
jgi:hypothetical protein